MNKILLTAAISFLTMCQSPGKNINDKDYEVITCFINTILGQIKHISIDSMYIYESSVRYSENDSGEAHSIKQRYINPEELLKNNISKELLDNFIKINKSSSKFNYKFNINLPYRFLTNDELNNFITMLMGLPFDTTLTSNEYRRIRKEREKIDSILSIKWSKVGGVKYFSKVGYNNNYTEAIFYICSYGGPLSATGNIVYMIKDNKNWITLKTIKLWES